MEDDFVRIPKVDNSNTKFPFAIDGQPLENWDKIVNIKDIKVKENEIIIDLLEEEKLNDYEKKLHHSYLSLSDVEFSIRRLKDSIQIDLILLFIPILLYPLFALSYNNIEVLFLGDFVMSVLLPIYLVFFSVLLSIHYSEYKKLKQRKLNLQKYCDKVYSFKIEKGKLFHSRPGKDIKTEEKSIPQNP